MKKTISCVVLLVVLLCTAFFIIKNINQSVYHYVEYNDLEQYVSQDEVVYVVLTRETCITCQKLSDDMMELKKENILNENVSLYAVEIEMDNKEQIFYTYGINGVPAILRFANGKFDQMLYQNITKEAIIDFFKYKGSE